MSGLLYRWGRLAAMRPWRVIAVWLVVVVAVLAGSAGFGRELEDSFVVPGLDSQQAVDLQVAAESDRAGLTAQVVVTPRDDDSRLDVASAGRSATDVLEAELADLPQVLGTTRTVSPDGRVALIRVQYPVVEQLDPVDLENLKELVADSPAGSLLQVEASGDLFFAFEEAPTGLGEAIGLLAAVVILLVAFGSVLAMGLPIGIALVGLTVSVSGLSLITYLIDIPSFAPVVGAMVGLGVGIDYALFVVTRHREYLAEGLGVAESAGRAVATAGQSVVFAGGVVVIAILGLAVSGIPFMTATGIAVSVVVGTMVVAAITLLPALLGLAGHRINGLRSGRRQRQETHVADRTWHRWGRHVSSHAWVYAVGATALLLALAAPALSLRLGFPDEGALPESRTERQAYDLLADGFGSGVNGPLVIAVDVSSDPGVLEPLAAAVAADPGVASVAPAELSGDGQVATLVAIPSTPPQDAATMETVERLRTDVFPDGAGRQRCIRACRWADRDLGRPRRSGGRPAPVVHRRRRAALLPAAHGRLPLGAGAAQGGPHEPAQHRGGLRRPRDGLPVGVGQGPHRTGGDRSGHRVHPHADVRDPVRALDGLRGLPAEQGPGGVPADGRQRGVGRASHRAYRSGDHERCAHHDRGLLRLHARR